MKPGTLVIFVPYPSEQGREKRTSPLWRNFIILTTEIPALCEDPQGREVIPEIGTLALIVSVIYDELLYVLTCHGDAGFVFDRYVQELPHHCVHETQSW